MSTTLGPNTQAPPSVLHERCIYCAGEDRRELLHALAEAGPPDAREAAKETRDAMAAQSEAHWYYRNYEFWRFRDFCMMLSGIGTGCLEPLLYEVLHAGVVARIVLVGTAGTMPAANVQLGQAYAIRAAWPAATGIDGEVANLPLSPHWKFSGGEQTATGVSSDFYYGFAPAVLEGRYPIDRGPLRARFEEHLRRGTELVDMEMAQFYFLCRSFGGDEVQYLAVKGAANQVGRGEQQSVNTRSALISSLQMTFRLLGVAGR